MIKSWNRENVEIAQREVSEPWFALFHEQAAFMLSIYLTLNVMKCIWATQEKNLAVLTEAYHTSRHVILFFSVNKSAAFQGYVSRNFSFVKSMLSVT